MDEIDARRSGDADDIGFLYIILHRRLVAKVALIMIEIQLIGFVGCMVQWSVMKNFFVLLPSQMGVGNDVCTSTGCWIPHKRFQEKMIAKYYSLSSTYNSFALSFVSFTGKSIP